MLTSLYIKNYALIENLNVSFNSNFSTITGETGAGKSILLGALSLVLGKRADISLVYDKNKKCVVEANFNISNYNLISFFDKNDLDYEQETNIRREILPNGKSRAFVNDTPVNLNLLNELTAKLVDIHSQHETLQLADTTFQFQILDALAKNDTLLKTYRESLTLFKTLNKEIKTLELEQEKAKKEFDYNNFLFKELDQINLQVDEQDLLEESLRKLTHVEEIKQNLIEVAQIANNEQIGLKDLLNRILNNINKISNYSDTYQKLNQRIDSLIIELNDIIDEVEHENDRIEYDGNEIEKISERLHTIYGLQKKHTVSSVKELIEIKDKLENQVSLVETSDALIQEKNEAVNKVRDSLENLSTSMYKNRLKAIPVFIKKMESILFNLEMKNTKLAIEIYTVDDFLFNGKNKIEFKISSDKGKSFENLKKSASGGEISRIMLAVKSIVSDYSKLPTIIFDEIDSGVSGEVSNKIAELMSKMSENMQVISITHLPQVASKGNDQFKVYKEETENSVFSNIKKLDQEERIIELAEMLGGKRISQSAIAHAKQLLN